MKNKGLQRKDKQEKAVRSAKECAYLAMFVALVIAVQLVLSAVPGVELVTVLFAAYAFTMGVAHGLLAATAFTLLRQLVFPFSPTAFLVYIIYFNLFALAFGLLGKKLKNSLKFLWIIVLAACLGTVCFTMLDNLITPLWLGLSGRSAELYFKASLPFMLPQVICTAVSVAVLFVPLQKTFRLICRR